MQFYWIKYGIQMFDDGELKFSGPDNMFIYYQCAFAANAGHSGQSVFIMFTVCLVMICKCFHEISLQPSVTEPPLPSAEQYTVPLYIISKLTVVYVGQWVCMIKKQNVKIRCRI